MCMHVCMCALPTAAWLKPDPPYATGRRHSSLAIRVYGASGHGACAAAGGRDCRRQRPGTGRPTLFDVARARSLAVSLLFSSFFSPFLFLLLSFSWIYVCICFRIRVLSLGLRLGYMCVCICIFIQRTCFCVCVYFDLHIYVCKRVYLMFIYWNIFVCIIYIYININI